MLYLYFFKAKRKDDVIWIKSSSFLCEVIAIFTFRWLSVIWDSTKLLCFIQNNCLPSLRAMKLLPLRLLYLGHDGQWPAQILFYSVYSFFWLKWRASSCLISDNNKDVCYLKVGKLPFSQRKMIYLTVKQKSTVMHWRWKMGEP